MSSKVWDTTSSTWVGPTLMSEPGQDPVLVEQSLPDIPVAGTTQLYANSITGRPSARDDRGGDGMIDYRRVRGQELRQFRAALGARRKRPVNVVHMGDSLTEGAGAESFESTLGQINRRGLQSELKDGGVGYIAAYRRPDFAWDWTARQTLAGGAAGGDIGIGLARYYVLSAATTQTLTYTEFGDRVHVYYYGFAGSGTLRIIIDGTTYTQNTDSPVPRSGQVWESPALPLGFHTVVISSNAAANVYIEGVNIFATDVTSGIHLWNAGHGGYTAWRFQGGTGEDAGFGYGGGQRMWAQTFFQPHTVFDSGGVNVTSNGATPSTLTFGGTSPVLTANDIGEVVYGDITNNNIPRGMRIVTTPTATTCTVNKTVPAGSYRFLFTRGRVTDMVTNSTFIATSATAAFNFWDEGKTVSGTNIPSGTTITRVVNATTIHLSKQATGSGSGGTLQIKNRQKLPNRPHLFSMMFGGNEMMAFGVSKTSFKLTINNTWQTMLDVAHIDSPTMTGIFNDETPSGMVQSYWAPAALVPTTTVQVDITGGTTVTYTATPQTVGIEYMTRFSPLDVGKSVSGSGIPGGTTIATYISPTQVTLSATATNANNVTMTFTNRIMSHDAWMDFRNGNVELAEENNWAHVDYYNLVGYSGDNNYNLMHYDSVHPNGNGYQFMGDELNTVLGGTKVMGPIPLGAFDNQGEVLLGRGVDNYIKAPGYRVKTSADLAQSATASWQDIDFLNTPQIVIGPGETMSGLICLHYTSAVATTGINFRLSATGTTITDISMVGQGAASATSVAPNTGTVAALNTTMTFTGSGVAVPVVAMISFTVTAGTAPVPLNPQYQTEVNSSAVTLQRGSWAWIVQRP